jgi:hypothetical protein
MRTTLCVAMVAAAMNLIAGCDVAPDDRAELQALAAEEQDPEVRAELQALAAEGAEDDDDAEVPVLDDELTADADPAGGGCFFCPPPPTQDPATWTPVVQNPYVQVNQQGNAILYVQAAASFIALPGATLKLQVPFSTQTFGPFALSYDVSGTQIRANVTGAFPAGTCRMITVTNPNNKASAAVSLCR